MWILVLTFKDPPFISTTILIDNLYEIAEYLEGYDDSIIEKVEVERPK